MPLGVLQCWRVGICMLAMPVHACLIGQRVSTRPVLHGAGTMTRCSPVYCSCCALLPVALAAPYGRRPSLRPVAVDARVRAAGSVHHAQGPAQERGAVHWRLHAQAELVHSVRVHGWRQRVRLHPQGECPRQAAWCTSRASTRKAGGPGKRQCAGAGASPCVLRCAWWGWVSLCQGAWSCVCGGVGQACMRGVWAGTCRRSRWRIASGVVRWAAHESRTSHLRLRYASSRTDACGGLGKARTCNTPRVLPWQGICALNLG